MVNRIDLLPHLDYDLDKLLYNLEAVHPGVEDMAVSAHTGEGMDGFRDWLVHAAERGEVPRMRSMTSGSGVGTGP